MRKYRTILFDLDGTLLNSRTSVVQATFDTVCKFLPGRFRYEDIDAKFGEPFDAFLSGTEMEAQADELLAYYMQQVENNQVRLVQPYAFVREGISILRDHYQLAIVTNKERRLVMGGLDEELADAFETFICIDDVQQGKPSAEPIHKAISLLGASPEHCLMVGDTQYDILAAKNAGIDSVHMQYEEAGVVEVAATYEFRNFQELVHFLHPNSCTLIGVGAGQGRELG